LPIATLAVIVYDVKGDLLLTAETKLRRATLSARKAEEGVEAARKGLRAAIREARASGMTLDAIGQVVGVSRQRVLQLLQDRTHR
jgi:DNA-directed RNA polymerase sigma subunit (sigma70/sigma32)